MVKECSPKETVAQMLNALSSFCEVCLLLDSVKEREEERVLHQLLYCQGKSPEQNGINPSHWMKYINRNFNSETNFPARL